MDHFRYKDGELYAEGVAVTDIIDQHGSPCYIYSKATFERHWHAFNDAFNSYPHLVCYAVKANSNIAILNLLAQLGSGFDIVSAGELERVLFAGAEASKVVFSGIGNPESFKQTLINNNIKIEKEIIYPDHHQYTQKDIDHIRFQARRLNSKILTTEKDYIKIKSSKNNDIKYLKVELDIKNEDKLIDYLKMHT